MFQGFSIKSPPPPPKQRNTFCYCSLPPPIPIITSPGFSPVTAIVFAVFWSSTTATWRATWAMALRTLRCPSDAAAPTVDPRREPEIAHVLKGRKTRIEKKNAGKHKKRYLVCFFLCVFCLLMCVFSFWVWYFIYWWLLMMSISLSGSWKSVSCEMKV